MTQPEDPGRVEVRTRPDLDAYYYGFDPTGDEDIDRILGAVAWAGKAFHHTDNWTDDDTLGVSCQQNIQNAANIAARHRLTADDGFVRVPREPTRKMQRAGDDVEVDGVTLLSPGESAHVWSAMLAAAKDTQR